MRKRTLAREIALKILYIKEIRDESLDDLLKEYFEEHKTPDDAKEFAQMLASGTLDNCSGLDEVIKKYASNWDLGRMAAIDRNVLRMATYELIHLKDVPPKVTINEAVNLAKKFSQENSGKFVNGILDEAVKAMGMESTGENNIKNEDS